MMRRSLQATSFQGKAHLTHMLTPPPRFELIRPRRTRPFATSSIFPQRVWTRILVQSQRVARDGLIKPRFRRERWFAWMLSCNSGCRHLFWRSSRCLWPRTLGHLLLRYYRYRASKQRPWRARPFSSLARLCARF